MLLSLGNRKVQKNKITTASFGLRAGKTCPGKGNCQHECFAMVGNYNYAVVKNKQKERLLASRKATFADIITDEIITMNIGAVRIHDSGDYYSAKYLEKWIQIAERNPDITFYSYTKSVHFFKNTVDKWSVALPKNFVVTFSYGGKYDHLINPEKDKHALVFITMEQLLDHKYADTSKYDDNAYNPSILKVGLVAKKHRKRDKWAETLDQVTKAS